MLPIYTSIPDAELALRTKSELLNTHPLFAEIRTIEHLRTFMEWHVFPVWDFMSLLKRLQNDLSCTKVPWVPPKNIQLTRLINEIVTGEESDEHFVPGSHISHFGLYLAAMQEISASTLQAERFVARIAEGSASVANCLEVEDVHPAVARFVNFTISIAMEGKTSEVLGSFFHGREKVIPGMFQAIVDQMGLTPEQAPMFHYYLQRHIQLDGDEHGPAAERMLNVLYANEPEQHLALLNASLQSVEERLLLWDALLEHIRA